MITKSSVLSALRPSAQSRWLKGVSFILLIVIWQFLTLWISELPTPVETAVMFHQLVTVGEPILGRTLQQHAIASITIVLKGFVMGLTLAIPIGVLIGYYRLAEGLLTSIVETFRPIPPLAWIPLGFVVFRGLSHTEWFNTLSYGLGVGQSVAAMVQIFVVFIGAFFPILLNTIHGVKGVEPILLEVAQTFGARKRDQILKVVIPASSPSIMTGIRIGLGVGWECVVAAEMIGGTSSGVGLFIWDMYSIGGSAAEIVCGMITIGLVGYLMNEILLLIQRGVLRWSSQ